MNKKNLLITCSIFLFEVSSLFAQTAGIPFSEYNSLKELYDNSQGSLWDNNTNWMDTTNHKVAEWFGITVEDGHVTKIELPDNNLQEAIFANRVNWPELKVLDISSNSIDFADFSSLDSLSKLRTLKIENNRFLFKHIQPVFNNPQYEQLAAGLSYSPQAKVDIEENITIKKGEFLEMGINYNYVSPGDKLQWYKNDIAISGSTGFSFEKDNATTEDSGVYYLKITNPNVPGLTLQSLDKKVNVVDLVGGIARAEFNALVKLYQSTQGQNWKVNTNWLDTINCEVKDWVNVQVVDGHVTNLYLDSNNVAGVLPDELVNLTYLEGLHLFGNSVTGEIPKEIGKLTSLLYFSLSHNNLTGKIPESIFQIKNLYLLHLTNNNMEGKIPTEIANLTNLESLSLGQNNLNGTIPPEIGNLTKLRHLNLSHNALIGVIPAETGNLTNLRSLNLSNNFLEGPIPAELNNLTKAYRIDIENNLIGNSEPEEKSGFVKNGLVDNNRQIPDELAGLMQMDTLYLGGNKLQFNDIEAIFSWSNYSEFEDFIYAPQDSVGTNIVIEKNEYDNVTITINNYYPGPSDQYQWYKNGAEIPGANSANLNLSNLQTDDSGRYHCKITNPVASELTLFSRINSLAVEPTLASAGVPLSEYKALAELYHSTQGPNWKVNTNWLDTINCEVKDWANVQVVDGHVTNLYLDSNNVAGVLPDEIVNLTYLEGLSFFGNNITGSIPQEIDKLTNLLHITLSHNNLTGEIPESISRLNKLKHLFLDKNNLDGNIPPEIENLTNLEFLYLNNNNLNGPIPPEIGNLTKLLYLNLSHNALIGVIPAEFGNFTELRSLNLSNNFLEGPVPAELNNLAKASRIDIENNLIGNREPEEKSVFAKSGFAENNRQIPDELAGLMQMDTLYLGGNKLQFNDIEAIFSWENFSEFEDFIYAPQDSVGSAKTIEGKTGGEITIQIDNYFPGPSDQYQWFKNGEVIEGANNSSLLIENLAEADSGKYVCKITNPVAAELTLYSREIKLAVTKSTGITTIAQNVVSVYPNPAAGRLYLDVQNKFADLEIYNSTGSLVRSLPDITNGWIEISELREGIYLFKIKLKDSQTMFKKVIIRK
jgi:Leucine-rich repeat (LRR) protein